MEVLIFKLVYFSLTLGNTVTSVLKVPKKELISAPIITS